MYTMDEAQAQDNLLQLVGELQRRVSELEQSNVEINSLDEIAQEIGQIDYRARAEDGTTIMIMSAINLLEEFGLNAHFAGFDPNGAPTIWINSDTGLVTLNSVTFNGVSLGDALVSLNQEGFIIKQTATVGGETRVFQFGMESDGTYANGKIDFFEPGTSTTIPNGDFATNDMSNWTQDVGAWTVYAPNGGSARCDFTIGNPKISNTSRFAVTTLATLLFSADHYGSTYIFSIIGFSKYVKAKIDIEFYTAVTGGTLVSTVNLCDEKSGYLRTVSKNITVPATATHAKFVASCSGKTGYTDYFIGFDNFSVNNVGSLSSLIFRDDALYYKPNGSAEFAIAADTFSATTTSRGFSKTINDSLSTVYMEQIVEIKRTIKVKEITVDIYEASDYTLTIRDYESNAIATKAEAGLTLNSTKVFNMSDTLLVPGLYRIRLAGAANKRFALKTTGDTHYSDLSITGGVSLNGTQYGSYKAAFILTFYTKTK